MAVLVVQVESPVLRELRELPVQRASQVVSLQARTLVVPGRELPAEQQGQHLELSQVEEQAPQERNLMTVAVLGHQEFDLD